MFLWHSLVGPVHLRCLQVEVVDWQVSFWELFVVKTRLQYCYLQRTVLTEASRQHAPRRPATN